MDEINQYPPRAHVVWTAPNGTADVILPLDGTFYQVRVQKADGTWINTAAHYLTEADAKAAAKEADRFKPDGSGRFPVTERTEWKGR